jgi:hypothetical protein
MGRDRSGKPRRISREFADYLTPEGGEVQRSFSEEIATKDREFEIGGETFKWRELPFDEFKTLIAMEQDFQNQVAEANKVKEGEEEGDTGVVVGLDFLIKRITFFLDPERDSHRRFKALLKRKDNPVPHYQIDELHGWLWEQVSGRPPTTPSTSSNGVGDTTSTSQEESSLQEAIPTV